MTILSHNEFSKRFPILLVMPKQVRCSGQEYIFTLGLPLISAAMKLCGLEIHTLNLNHFDQSVEETLKEYFIRHGIKAVATGGMSSEFPMVRDVVKTVKTIDLSIITIVGGGLISAEPEVAMPALGYADYGVISEGEITACELGLFLEKTFTGIQRTLTFSPDLAKRVTGGKNIADFHSLLHHHNDISLVDGVIYRYNDTFVKTGKRTEIECLDFLPWADYEGFGFGQMLDGPTPGLLGITANRQLYIASSRSCPFSCTFCFHTSGSKYRQRDIQDFLAEIRYMIARYHVNYINIVDELFAKDKGRVREFCAAMKILGVPWLASFRVSDFDEEMLKLLKEGGINIVSLGIESANNSILKSMRKGITFEQTQRVLKMLYENGLTIQGVALIGDIEETMETAKKTIDFVREHSHYDLGLNIITPYPGTHDYRYARQHGRIPDPVKYLFDGCPPVNFSRIPDPEYKELVLEIFNNMGDHLSFTQVECTSQQSAEGFIDLRGLCPNCGRMNSFEKVLPISDNHLICQHCHQRSFLPCPSSIQTVLSRNLEGLVHSFGQVAIWGAIGCFRHLVKELPVLRQPQIHITDYSSCRWGVDFGGVLTVDTAVIDRNQIEVVLVTSRRFFAIISSIIRNRFPHVKHIIEINEFVHGDFQIPVPRN